MDLTTDALPLILGGVQPKSGRMADSYNEKLRGPESITRFMVPDGLNVYPLGNVNTIGPSGTTRSFTQRSPIILTGDD